MATYRAGAWWSAAGIPFATQQEADAYDASGGNNSVTDDSFAAAMGRGNGTGVRAPAGSQPATTTPMEQERWNRENARFQAEGGALARTTPVNPSVDQATADRVNQINSSQVKYPDQGSFLERAATDTAQIGSAAFNNPVLNPTTWGLTQGGRAVNNATGMNVSGYIQDPGGQALADIGAPDLVQAAYNPNGYATRQVVNAQTGYGTNVPQVAINGTSAARNLQNDARNTQAAVQAAPGYVSNIAGGLNLGAQRATPNTTAPTVQQPQLTGMTPQSIMAMNNQIARPSSAQQDAIVNQMLAQSQQQSAYQDFSSPQYDQSRSTAMGYTSQLAGLANNNIPVQALNSGQYNQSRGLMEGTYGSLGNQANNNIADIYANQAQRSGSRGAVMDTAGMLTSNASRDIGNIYADTTNSLQSRTAGMNIQAKLEANAYNDAAPVYAQTRDMSSALRDVADTESLLRGSAANGVRTKDASRLGTEASVLGTQADGYGSQANATQYNQSRDQQNAIIQQLVAAGQLPEGQSAAEALMLNAQERAVRNAYGDAGGMAGGWRSQLTGQRRALGQAAAQQADIAAQMGALRAQETQQHRQRQIEALNAAGGLSGNVSELDLALAQGDAQRALDLSQGNANRYLAINQGNADRATNLSMTDAQLRAQILLGNQTNATNALTAAGQLGINRGDIYSNVATSDANRIAAINQANQANRLNSLTNSGALATQIQGLDQNLAISDADRSAVLAQANQQNRLNSLLGAGNLQTGVMNSDTDVSISDANRVAQIRQANQANALNSYIAQGNLATNMNTNDLNFATNDLTLQQQARMANQSNALNAMLGASNNATQQARTDADIGITNANNRVTVDQNNRANSIQSLQNAGVLSSNTRGQDIQVSTSNQQAISNQISSAAGLQGTVYSSQMQAAIANSNNEMRQRELNRLAAQDPTSTERYLRAGGYIADILL